MTRRFAVLTSLIVLLLMTLPSAVAQDDVEITIFVDQDTLVVYVPGNQPVSLQDLGFEVVINDTRQLFRLDQFPAFKTVRFDVVPTPICFRLARDGSNRALPLECDSDRTLTQSLANANVFWYDSVANYIRTLLLMSGADSLDLCAAGQASCSFVYVPPAFTPTPITPTLITVLPATSPPILTPTLSHTATVTSLPPATQPSKPTDTSEATDPLGAALERAQNFSGTANGDWEPFVWEFDGVEMVLVPVGCFTIGSNNGENDEKNGNEVCFDEPFWIDKYEVTNAQFGSIADEASCDEVSFEQEQPCNCISWFDARDFCERRDSRLPTEAEWEYAARGPNELVYPWGNEFVEDNVIYGGSPQYGSTKTAPVGSRLAGASWVGALDMSGNVWEWTNSLFEGYPYDATDGRERDTGDSTAVRRVLRGGSLTNTAFHVRAASRTSANPDSFFYPYTSRGFRCARSVD